MKTKNLSVFFITKWCLTRGVLRVHGYLDENRKYVVVPAENRNTFRYIARYKRDAFDNAPDAYRRAIEVAKRREESLQNELTKVRALRRNWGDS